MERLRPSVEKAGHTARLLAAFLVAAALSGCGGRARPPDHLLGGAPAPALPPALTAKQSRLVMTRTRVAPIRELEDGRLRACLRMYTPLKLAPTTAVVVRAGVEGTSATFRRGRWLYSCDGTAGPAAHPGPWCGGAVGRIRRGHLTDPRLNMLCRDDRGRLVGFAWIDPVPGAQYVAVEGSDFTEVYEVVGRLPVRLTTSEVQVEGSSATFQVAQYDANGAQLSHETLRATVAG